MPPSDLYELNDRVLSLEQSVPESLPSVLSSLETKMEERNTVGQRNTAILVTILLALGAQIITTSITQGEKKQLVIDMSCNLERLTQTVDKQIDGDNTFKREIFDKFQKIELREAGK